MSKLSDFSETTEHNMSFCYTNPSNMNMQWGINKTNPKSKKRVFEVFHKKEMIYLTPDSISSNDGEKIPSIQYKCIYCGNKYNNMNRFEAHMRIHVSKNNFYFIIFILQTGEKPYKCIYCNKIFTEKGNLKVHIRVHTNDRPYHCPFTNICKQSFKTKSQLSDHILKHTQVKNYSCPECKASFSRKSRLKIHLMIHRGEKPFQCNICNKKFREKSNYNYHIKKHFVKTIKTFNKKSENKTDEIVMDNNINNFSIIKNKNGHKSSDLSNNSNSTNSNSNNNSDFNNSDNEINYNKESSAHKISGTNKKNPNYNSTNNLNFWNYPFLNNFGNKYNNKLTLFEREDELKSIDEQLAKNDLNINNMNNQILDYFFSDNNSNNIFYKEDTQLKEENAISNIKEEDEEKNKTVQNYDDEVSIVNNNGEDMYLNSAIKEKNKLIADNNNIENVINNKILYNYYQGDLSLHFENMFLKNNFN